ncbi:hypothetical protein Y032_0053g2303 [Ancylostoma ceylanicum]|uniref:Uncharacterized protein n=1 Tax=Ancylostoma ceylanicum TaxID=53326 RepID=A0A016U795_9BILA|nr:hypothetical protein Y032_0053g2303 [Ancylostoma ceylanicum]
MYQLWISREAVKTYAATRLRRMRLLLNFGLLLQIGMLIDILGHLLQLVERDSTHLSHHSLENMCISPQRCLILKRCTRDVHKN